MTNYEWLLQMGGEERQAWFDAEHVDANDISMRKNDVRADGVCANDVDVSQDSREKLEADVASILRNAANHTSINTSIGDMLRYTVPGSGAAPWQTEEDACEALASIAERQIAELTAERDELKAMNERLQVTLDAVEGCDERCLKLEAERDALADDLLTCNKEREEYRELFSKSLTLAAEIVNLQP